MTQNPTMNVPTTGVVSGLGMAKKLNDYRLMPVGSYMA